jgi:hypothetical protein
MGWMVWDPPARPNCRLVAGRDPYKISKDLKPIEFSLVRGQGCAFQEGQVKFVKGLLITGRSSSL